MQALAWVTICLGIAAIVAGFHKHTLWGVTAAWLEGKPLTVTTTGHVGTATHPVTTAVATAMRQHYVTTVQHGK